MTREEYLAIDAFHYSGLKMFARCPRLYYEKYIAKTYIEPEQDYFLYGNIVDCLLTQHDDFDNRFVKVARRSDGSTLGLEMKIGVLEQEIAEREILAGNGNKPAIKGIESRQKKLVELRAQIEDAKAFGDKIQVPLGIWTDAHETAEAIKLLPLHDQLVSSGWECEAQKTVVGKEGVNRKGIIDRLYTKDGKAIIEDIKTTFRLVDLDPNIYSGQLAYYKKIIEEQGYDVLECYASVGDKGKRKLAQDFRYAPQTLELALEAVLKTESLLIESIASGSFPSAKSLRGREQTCFSCSECSVRPFSVDTPVTI